MLTPPSAREHELAKQLLEREAAGHDDPAALAAAAERVLQQLRVHLSRWFGTDGFFALLNRALDRARLRYPTLANVRSTVREAQCLDGLAESTRSLSSAEAAEMLVAVITALIGLLSRLVGEDMAIRLVEQSRPDVSRAVPRTNKERMSE